MSGRDSERVKRAGSVMAALGWGPSAGRRRVAEGAFFHARVRLPQQPLCASVPASDYGYGWGARYGGTDIRTDTIVSIETLVYSLSQNRLVWGGQSRTTNPSDLDALVREVAAAVAGELADEGLIGPS